MDGRFTDRVAVITGGAGGIGLATARRLAAEGAGVALVDLPAAPLDQAVAAVTAAGGRALAIPADVTRAADLERVMRTAAGHFGGIDIVCNNAGIEGWIGPLTEYPEEIFDRVLAVNVKGVWLGMKAAAPYLRQRGGGAIINTASTAGVSATRHMIAYSTSKHAVIGLTRTAAVELARDKIRVNAICPAPTETRMMRSIERGYDAEDPARVHEALAKQVPLRRYALPEEIAGLVAYLASADAAFVTGGVYLIDGGQTA